MRLSNVGDGWTWNVPLSTGILILTILVLGPLFGSALALEGWPIIFLVVLLAATPVFVRWPIESTFGVYAFLVPFDAVTLISDTGGSTLTRLAGILSAGVLLTAGLLQPRRRLVRPPMAAVWWGLFITWGFLSAAWALDAAPVIQRVPTALSIFLLYLVAVSTRPTRTEFLRVCVLAVLGGVMAAAVGYLSSDVGSSARGTLIVGEYAANPNQLAAVLILPLALAIGACIKLRGAVVRTVMVMAIGLIALGIYITASRKAVLAMIMVILVLLYRSRTRWPILMAVVVVSILVAVTPQAFTDRIEDVFSGKDSTGAGRTEIWSVGLQSLQRFGLVGAGLDNFTAVYGRHVVAAPKRPALGAHNLYLAVWVELGIVGLVLVLAAVSSNLLGAYRVGARETDRTVFWACEAACLGMLVISFFADTLWSKFFWLPWILLTWAARTQPSTVSSSSLGARQTSRGRIE